MNDYLLLKATLLEHATEVSSCKTSEDILTIICQRPPSPTPTATPTVTPTVSFTPTTTPSVTPTTTVTSTVTATPTLTPSSTRNDIFANSLTILSGSNYISGDGLTFTGITGDKLEYNKLNIPFDLPFITNIVVDGTIRATIILPSSGYINKAFKVTLDSVLYFGSFVSGNINLIRPSPTPTATPTTTRTPTPTVTPTTTRI